MKYSFEIFADYFQFYLEDEIDQRPAELDWNSQNLADLVIEGSSFVAIGTVRNMTVPVAIEVYQSEPSTAYLSELFEKADQVVKCAVEFRSGSIVVKGPTDYFPDAPRIPVTPGIYICLIYFSHLDTLSDNGLEGDDKYQIILYMGQFVTKQVLKSKTLSK